MSNKVEKVIKIIKEEVLPLMGLDEVQTFDTRNIIGDSMHTIYNDEDITVDVCYGYEYIEVFGLTDEEYDELLESNVCY